MVKVEWQEHYGTDATCEREEEMQHQYPHLFLPYGKTSLRDQTYLKGGECNNPTLVHVLCYVFGSSSMISNAYCEIL